MPNISRYPARHQLSVKIAGVLIGFLLLALSAIGATLFLSWQLEGSAAAINETGSLRMYSYRLAAILARHVEQPASADARDKGLNTLEQVDAKLDNLRRGEPQRPLLLPPTRAIHVRFDETVQQWQNVIRPLAVDVMEQSGPQAQRSWVRFQNEINHFVADVDTLVHAIERDSEMRTFWLRLSQFALAALALVGTVVVIYLMFLFIIVPVTRLREGIERMTEKDFSVRLRVDTKDEFGELALGFNEMADRLEGLYTSLEERVKSKTAALAQQNRELSLLYDTAAFLQRPQTVEAMCSGFLERIIAYFGAKGGSVRTIDDQRGNLHMVAHHGIPDGLVKSEQCMKVGDCLCGEAAAKEVSVVHDLRNINRASALECEREGFRTVAVFHIYAHQQHIGFYNLHFQDSTSFTESDHALLETLGQLLGTGIENRRLVIREREMAISEERNLVAQGLHDSIAQGLTFLNIQLQMLDDSLREGKTGEAQEIVPMLRTGVQESYEDVRELLLNFRSRLNESDLVDALRTTVQKFRLQTGIDTKLHLEGQGRPIPREQQLQILFIVQEALSNVRKHAMAKNVEVNVADGPDFVLRIRDNGVGFDAQTVQKKGDSHVGLSIMQERAQRIHAGLTVVSQPGEGTTVTLELPSVHRHAA